MYLRYKNVGGVGVTRSAVPRLSVVPLSSRPAHAGKMSKFMSFKLCVNCKPMYD